MKARKLFIYLIAFLFLSVRPLFATESDIVINELMPNPSPGKDWVELYNLSVDSVDISGWILKDSTSEIYNIQEATVSGHGFVVFEVGSRLDKNGDTVYILNNGNEINSCEYSKYHGDNISIGRYPDGYGVCSVLDNVSRGGNNSPLLPTSTPTPTPTPANTPTPTKTPTSVPGATNTPVPTPVSTSTPIPTDITPSPTSKTKRVLDLFLPTSKPEAQIDAVLGEATSEADTFNLDLGGLFMSLGGLFVAGAGFYVAQLKARPFIT